MTAYNPRIAFILIATVILLLKPTFTIADTSSNEDHPPEDSEVIGWPVYYGEESSCTDAELEADDRPVICVGAELYGAFHRVFVEDKQDWHNHSRTDYQALPVIKAALPEIKGWRISGLLEWEMNEEVNETSEAYITFARDNFWIDAGLMDVGGVDQGNEFVTELGEDATGDYGDRTGEQTYLQIGAEVVEDVWLATAYSVRHDDISFEEDYNEGDISNYHIILLGEFDALTIGAEYELIDASNNDQNVNEDGEQNRVYDSESALGIGISYNIDDWLIPFINYGQITENHEEEPGQEIKVTELNIGADIWLQDDLGLTIGYEQISDDGKLEDGRNTVDINNAYISVRYIIGNAHAGISYWWSDQRVRDDNDNVAGQLDLEVGLVF